MTHLKEEQISAYVDEQIGREEKLVLEAHLRDCGKCRAVRDELLEITRLFREADRFEPSPFLWKRIASDFGKETSSTGNWMASFVNSFRRNSWNLRLASAALVVFAVIGIVAFHGNSIRIAEQAALADIDRTHRNLAALDPDTYNPFGSELPGELDANPFRSMRLSTGEAGQTRPSRDFD